MIGAFNYGNIRTNPANDWLGRTTQPGAAFESFDTAENGVRALAKVLQTYGRQGVNTLENIIGRYSPPHENRTPRLIQAAAQRTGWSPTRVLDLSDPAVLNTLATAIIKQEVGNAGPGADVIQRGVSAATQPGQRGKAMPNRSFSFASPGGQMPALSIGVAQPGWEPLQPDPLGGPALTQYQPPAQATQPPGLIGKPTRTDELLGQMTGLLGNGQAGPPPDRFAHTVGGMLNAVAPLMGPQREKVSPWQVLAGLGGGMQAGQQGYQQAQREYRGQQLQDVQAGLKVEDLRTSRETQQRELQATHEYADTLEAAGHPDLAAAVRGNKPLMDEVLKAQANQRFAKETDQTAAVKNALALGLTPGSPEWKEYIRATSLPAEAQATGPQKDAEALGLVRGTPEYDDYIRKRTIPVGTQVTVGAQERAEDKAFGEQLVKDYAEVTGAGRAAEQSLAQIEIARKIPVVTGATAPWLAKVGAMAQALGFDKSVLERFNLGNATEAQSFIGVMNNLVLSKMQAQKGPQTENDAKRIEATLASLGNTPEAADFLLRTAQALNQRDVDRAQFWDRYRAGPGKGSLEGAPQAWRDHLKNTPMVGFNKATKKPVFFDEFMREARKKSAPDVTDQELLDYWRQNYGG